MATRPPKTPLASARDQYFTACVMFGDGRATLQELIDAARRLAYAQAHARCTLTVRCTGHQS